MLAGAEEGREGRRDRRGERLRNEDERGDGREGDRVEGEAPVVRVVLEEEELRAPEDDQRHECQPRGAKQRTPGCPAAPRAKKATRARA